MSTHTFELNGFGSNEGVSSDSLGPDGKLRKAADAKPAFPSEEERKELQTEFFEDDEEVRLMNPGTGIGNYEVILDKPAPVKKEPAQDIADFFDAMKGQKQILLAMMECCREEASAEEINAAMAPYTQHRRSVYSPINLRRLLVEHQALEHLETASLEPVEGVLAEDEEYSVITDEEGYDVIIDKDGNLIVTQNVIESWKLTEAGAQFLDSQHPMEALETLLAKEPQYLTIYQRILLFCSQQSRTGYEINDIVDNDPLVQKPRRFSQYFLGRLEAANAMNWEENWAITSLGLEYLDAHKEDMESVNEQLEDIQKQLEEVKQAAEKIDPYVITEPWEVVDA